MQIRRFIASFSLLLISLICPAQSEFMVVVKSGVFIRDSTTINSNVVGSVKFGQMVQVLNGPRAKDEVNGMKGNWLKIKYNTYAGYIFDAYLGNFMKRDTSFSENFPQYFRLNASCGEEQYFDSDRYWYGVFDQGDNFRVALVTLEFSVKSENWKDEMYDQYLKIDISSAENPMFLIGLVDSIENYAFRKGEFMANRSRQIYPGQHFHVSNPTNKHDDVYYLASYGNVKAKSDAATENFISPFMTIKDYEIRIVHSKNGISRTKNILEDVDHPVIYESMPNISFVGDLNHDSVPDIVFSYMTSHASSNTYLFMSGYSNKEILTKVGLNRWGGCY
jgi:hypothetical protein